MTAPKRCPAGKPELDQRIWPIRLEQPAGGIEIICAALHEGDETAILWLPLDRGSGLAVVHLLARIAALASEFAAARKLAAGKRGVHHVLEAQRIVVAPDVHLAPVRSVALSRQHLPTRKAGQATDGWIEGCKGQTSG